jgi:hypothetical protein
MNTDRDFPMRLVRRTVILVLLALITVPAAVALERSAYSLEVLVDGLPLEEHAARGTTYIEAIEGREYSLRLRNHTGRRVAIALSVDGLNSIDAKETTARNASKWILGPYETLTLDGWQTGPRTARRFFFTTEDRSYGAWLGKTSNLGVISAAVFREKPKPAPIVRRRFSFGGAPRPSAREGSGLDAPSASDAAERGAAEPEMKARSEEAGCDAGSQTELSDELAATGIGREVEHRVHRVRFESERHPAAVMELRYEYHDALVRLGVLPPSYARREAPLDRRERAHGFKDFDFAPDPY